MTVTKSNGSESHSAMNSQEFNESEDPKIRTLTREEINEQIKSFVAQLTRQLEVLTHRVQGLLVASHPKHYPRTDMDASYNAHGYSPDTKGLQYSKSWKIP